MKIFFDLDGTVIDSRLRLFLLFNMLVSESKLSFEQYWDLKKSGYNHSMILKEIFNYSDPKITEFETKWMSLIETSELLDIDNCFEYTIETLEYLSERATLFIVTDRQYKERTIAQLKKLDIFKFFSEVLVTEQRQEKSTLILLTKDISNNDYIIGDTGRDILAGKKIGLKTIAVLSGFMHETKLVDYNPDKILNDISELVNYI